MSVILFFIAVTAVILLVLHFRGHNVWYILQSNLFILLFSGIVIRFLATGLPASHPTDMNCFKAWANMLFENGLSKFYGSKAFTDYPPGYMYVLYLIGGIKSLFKLDPGGFTYELLIKLPAMLADVGVAFFIYKLAKKYTQNEQTSFQLALFYSLNPVVILVSSVWGQVDSIHTLLILASIYYIVEKKMLQSVLLFAVSVLIKPQAFMFTPIYLYAFWYFIKNDDENSISSFFNGAAAARLLGYGALCIALIAALILPFIDFNVVNGGRLGITAIMQYWGTVLPYPNGTVGESFSTISAIKQYAGTVVSYPKYTFIGEVLQLPVIKQYGDTLASYPFATVNAYNFYALFGLNWKPVTETFLGLTYNTWGMLALVATVLFSLCLLGRSRVKSNFFFTAAVINICTFMFSIKMHERYNFPVLALLLAAYAIKGDKRIKYLYGGFSLAFFLNYADVLNMSINKFNYDLIKYTAIIFSVPTLFCFAYAIYTAFKSYDKASVTQESLGELQAGPLLAVNPVKERPFHIEASAPPTKYTSRDFIALFVITAVYAIVGFHNLGNKESAQTMYTTKAGDVVTVDFGMIKPISRLQYMLGARHDKNFYIALSYDNVNWTENTLVEAHSVFAWDEKSINSEARYVRFTIDASDFMMIEMALRDKEDNMIPIMRVSPGGEPLFDEQQYVPESKDYMNSTYFDEIYHPRTAYEFVHGLNVYEWTHPPLGKVIMSWGVSAFGMTPFGWRVAGTAFGVMMVPLLFLFAKKIFNSTFWASFAAILLSGDFMHFAQTRLATIDTYITFFVIAMYYFMYQYYTTSFYDKKLYKTLIPLFFSGLFMGLGIASKWPGMYAAAGLAILFFATLYKRYNEYAYAKNNNLQGEYHNFWRYARITCAWCLLFFVAIPVLIYVLSYIPYYYGTGSLYPDRAAIGFLSKNAIAAKLLPDSNLGNFIAAIVQNQIDMFNYHSKLESTHPYSAVWWQWLIDWRPIYYFSNTVSDGVRQGISSFGNPAVWWTGLAAFFICLFQWVSKGGKRKFFLVVAYLAQLVPWMFVSRTTYIYHYFPCVPFLVLMITYCFKKYCSTPKRMYAAYAFLGITALLFLLFYPILSGKPVNVAFVTKYLKWPFMPGWQLI